MSNSNPIGQSPCAETGTVQTLSVSEAGWEEALPPNLSPYCKCSFHLADDATEPDRSEKPMIIDVHSHYLAGDNYGEELVAECERLGIEAVCLSACGEQFNQPGDEAVEALFTKYPGRVIGFGYFRLGRDLPGKVDDLKQRGFGGVKFISPLAAYDDDAYLPVYERAATAGLPTLFHTGLMANLGNDHKFDVSSDRMRPVCLDRIARTFPQLTIIGAHLGVPWFDVACGLARVHKNVYFDLSGVIGKLIDYAVPSRTFWWQEAREKFLFGLDCHWKSFEGVIAAYERLFEHDELPAEMRAAVMGGTAAGLLGLSSPES